MNGKNLIQDSLGLTCDCVYQWRTLLEKYSPKNSPRIVHIKGIHNTVADAISRLDYGPIQDDKANWMTFMKCWCHFMLHRENAMSTYNHQEQMNLVFANQREVELIDPLRLSN